MTDKIKAVMLGHAVGDALGVPAEFHSRESLRENPVTDMMGYGTHHMPAGTWSDDTSMSLCALDSLAKGTVDYAEIMNHFCRWYKDGEFTATGETFDVGGTCANAVENYLNGYAAEECGERGERSNGNGSLMRIHPFVLYAYYNNIEGDKFADLIMKASALTHAHRYSLDGCIIYAYILKELLDNPHTDSVYTGINKAKSWVQSYKAYSRLFNENIDKIPVSEIKSSGYVVYSLEAAVWCLLTTSDYRGCVLKAVNLGGDTDTVAAIAGGLAGALYGMESIPAEWLQTLKRAKYIEVMCENAGYKWRTKEN